MWDFTRVGVLLHRYHNITKGPFTGEIFDNDTGTWREEETGGRTTPQKDRQVHTT